MNDNSGLVLLRAFVNGYVTGIDMMTKNAELRANEYRQGHRHALDLIMGYIDEIEREIGGKS
jgi:hypothetical protein